MLSSSGDTINCVNYLVFLAVGKLLIYAVGTAGILTPIWAFIRVFETRLRGSFAFFPSEYYLVDEFRECGWCIGVWVFSFLAIYGRINIFEFFPNGIISYILTGIASSFIVHLVSGGYHYHFGEGS